MSVFNTRMKESALWASTAYRNSNVSRINVICRLEIALYRMLYKNESIFQVIYRKNMWGREIKSGGGSLLGQTVALRQALPGLVRRIGAHTVLDAACGDYHWMKTVALECNRYIGIEIVPELVDQNCKEYGSEKITFLNADITRNRLPQADLIICRDVLVHLSFDDIGRAIENFKHSNSRFLLTTTYPGVSKNCDILSGMWRPMDLQLPPFDFPSPIELINEECDLQTDHPQKSLGLWDLRRLSGG